MKYKDIEQLYKQYNYKFFKKHLSLNIFGIRNNNPIPNKFDDIIGVAYTFNGKEILNLYEGTTDPGKTVLGDKFGGVNGTLILPPKQYLQFFKIGYHHNKYKCLIQNYPIEVIRDRNKDNLLTFDSTYKETGMFGIHLHHANESIEYPSIEVNNWSWGCQVIRKITDWELFWLLIEESANLYGDIFTYTLFNK